LLVCMYCAYIRIVLLFVKLYSFVFIRGKKQILLLNCLILD
jgi:hypothetical protein